MVSAVLPGQNKWDHCTHLTWKLGHWLKWDHYKHPLLYHCVLCWGDLLSLDHGCGYQYALLNGQCVYGLYSFGCIEQVRPLHTPYLKPGPQDEVRPLQAPFHITLCSMLGCCFRIKSYLWVPKRTVQMSLCLWFVLFCLGRTSDTTARILLENWVTSLGETTTSIPYYISLCTMLGWCFLIRSYPCVSAGSL